MKKKGTTFSIEMYFPIGYDYQAEINLLKIWLIGSIICSFSFFSIYMSSDKIYLSIYKLALTFYLLAVFLVTGSE